MRKTQRKTIAFPTEIILTIENIAAPLGMNFTDYIRYLAIKEADKNRQAWIDSLPTVDLSDSTIKNISKSRAAIARGEGKTFDSAKDLMKYIQRLEINDEDEQDNRPINDKEI